MVPTGGRRLVCVLRRGLLLLLWRNLNGRLLLSVRACVFCFDDEFFDVCFAFVWIASSVIE